MPLCGATEATEAVGAAKAAQPAWAEMGMPARRVCLASLAQSLDGYAGHFAQLLSAECGFDEARAMAEVEEAVAALQGAMVGQTGILGLVLDGSRPLASFAEIIAPAVMAGATVVVKPSPKAPSAVYALCELASRAEWPGACSTCCRVTARRLPVCARPESTALSMAATLPSAPRLARWRRSPGSPSK